MIAVLGNWVASPAIDLAGENLSAGGDGLDAIERALNKVECDPAVPHLGIGGMPNALGIMQCDGGIMDGSTGEVGAIAALSVTPRAISVARRVLEFGMHSMLVGEGADRFARENGIVGPAPLSASASDEYRDWRAKHFRGADMGKISLIDTLPGKLDYIGRQHADPDEKDTAILIALDHRGDIKVGTSTSGWAFKYPGRVGDCPITGGGFYALNGVGAAACTHTGENAMRAAAAATVVNGMACGLSLERALEKAGDRILSLRNGTLGPVVIHGMTHKGEMSALAVRFKADQELPVYYAWHDKLQCYEQRSARAYGND